MRFWGRGDELEELLRSGRPEARREFVASLSQRVNAPARQRRQLSRLAFAAALTTFMLGSLASFGAIGYASSATRGTVSVVKRIVVKSGPAVTVRRNSAAAAQYNPPPPPPPAVANVVEQQNVVGAVKPAQASELPFTGLSLLATVVFSLALVALGVLLRRRERNSDI